MAMIPGGFNAANVDPTDNFAPLPNGSYSVVITESDVKTTKAGTGQYLQLVLEVIEGPMKGRKVWDRLNIVNPSKTAQEIGERALSQICHAIGVLVPQDSSELHGKPLVADVVIKEDPGYKPSNEVNKYSALDGTPAPAPAAQAAPEAPAPQAPAAPVAPPTAAAAQVATPPWGG